MKKVIIVTIAICLLICGVNAWVIDDAQGRVQGTVDFYADGKGVVNATGYPLINFNWYLNGDVIRANYLFYGIDVYYNASTDELYSPSIANVTLKR